MKLIVISPESHDPRELPVVRALFAAGLERYHLRKPNWSSAELETWLGALSPDERRHVVVHAHPELVQPWGLAGQHERDEGTFTERSPVSLGLRSRSCHDLETLRACLGTYDAVLLSPIFASISKPGYGPSGTIDLSALKELLTSRSPEQRRTAVYALGGIDAANTETCRSLGFDGVAVLGAIWGATDPVEAFGSLVGCVILDASRSARAGAPATSAFPRHPVMALTQDGLPLSHLEQATQLCVAGARWIQLRMKDADPAEWLATAQAVGAICREHGAIFIVNDSVDVALQSGADGVHLGKLDLDWTEARQRLGPDRIIGGTINNSVDAALARAAGCLNYVGVGPWRFTSNKKNLAPVLGAEGVQALIGELEGLPAWVIGGIEASDLPAVRATGAAGVAVSSALYRGGGVEKHFRSFQTAWSIPLESGSSWPPKKKQSRANPAATKVRPPEIATATHPYTP